MNSECEWKCVESDNKQQVVITKELGIVLSTLNSAASKAKEIEDVLTCLLQWNFFYIFHSDVFFILIL